MDDGANVDLVDVSPIGSPDRLRIPTKQLWGGREPHSDDETDGTDGVADNPEYHNGPPQWLPYSRRGFRGIKSLTVDTSLSPPFPSSSGYLSTVEGTPSPLSSTSDCFDLDDSSSPPAKVDENMRFQYSPNLSIYDSEELNGARPWNLHCNFSAMWDGGEDSDGSEASDESKGYITFAGESVSSSPEVGLEFQQFNLSEPSAFVLDFPEDVGELLEHDGVSVDGDSGAIGSFGRPTSAPAPEIVELSVHTPEGPQDLPDYVPNIFLPRIRESSEDSAESESFPHLPYPEPGVANPLINVPLSPLMLTTDGFPDVTSTPHSDPVGVEVEETPTDMDWLEGPLEEMACSPCLGDFLEWDRWHGWQVEEPDRDLDSWARVHESVRAGLDRF